MYWTVSGFLAVLTLSLACYWNSLDGDLVHDDRFAIKENMDVRPEAPLWRILQNDFWGKKMSDPTSHKSYRPLTTLTFRMNYFLHQLHPWGYHTVNVVLHSLASLLVVAMSWNVVFGALRPAVLTGFLFAAHPVHTEAVSDRVEHWHSLQYTLIMLCLSGNVAFARFCLNLAVWQGIFHI